MKCNKFFIAFALCAVLQVSLFANFDNKDRTKQFFEDFAQQYKDIPKIDAKDFAEPYLAKNYLTTKEKTEQNWPIEFEIPRNLTENEKDELRKQIALLTNPENYLTKEEKAKEGWPIDVHISRKSEKSEIEHSIYLWTDSILHTIMVSGKKPEEFIIDNNDTLRNRAIKRAQEMNTISPKVSEHYTPQKSYWERILQSAKNLGRATINWFKEYL